MTLVYPTVHDLAWTDVVLDRKATAGSTPGSRVERGRPG
jgi:hypothetical protein